MELNNKLTDFFNKEIYEWVKTNFGESEANDPSWSIKDLSEHLSTKLQQRLGSTKLIKYDFSIILRAGSDVHAELDKIDDKIKELGGRVDHKQAEGIKTMPYMIDGEKRADYNVWEIQLTKGTTSELSSWLNLQTNVLRYLIIVKDERRHK